MDIASSIACRGYRGAHVGVVVKIRGGGGFGPAETATQQWVKS
jgi:hypothetical protein